MNKIKLFAALILIAFAIGTSAQSYIQIGNGTVSTSYPPYSVWNYGWYSVIFTQAELGSAKSITKIAFDMTSIGPYNYTNQKIYVKHTSNFIFGDASYENPESNGYTKVFDGSINYNQGWTEITFSAPFSYNGTNNLIIHYENRRGASPYKNFNSTASVVNNNKSNGNDGSFPTGAGYLNPYPSSRPNIRIYYAATGPVTPSNLYPANNAQKVNLNDSLGFTFGANTTKYDVYFGTDSAAVADTNTSVRVVSDMPCSTGDYNYDPMGIMTSGTKYFWKVVAENATEREASTLMRFTTQNTIHNFPYTQGFDDSTVFKPGWYGQYTDWTYPTTSPNAIWYAHNTNYLSAPYAAYASATDTNINSPLMTPRIQLPTNHRISFWWKNSDTKTAGHDTTFFEISTNGALTWAILDTLAPESQNSWTQNFYNLNSYSGDNVYMRWRYKLNGAWQSAVNFFLDDILIEEAPVGPVIALSDTSYAFKEVYVNGYTYSKPIVITNIGTTDLTISNTIISAPFNCSYSGTLAPMESDTIQITFTPTTSGSFTEQLTFQIDSSFGGDNTITLHANALNPLTTLFESFDAVPVNTIPAHWNKNINPDVFLHDVQVKSDMGAYSAPNELQMYNNDDTISPLLAITPGLTDFATNKFSFWGNKSWLTINEVKISVGLMDDPYDATSYEPIDTIILSDTIKKYSFTFSNTNTKPYIAIAHITRKSVTKIHIDDVSWEPDSAIYPPNPAVCVRPVNGSDSVLTKPHLQWSSGGGMPTGYILYVGTNYPPTNIIDSLDMGTQTDYYFTDVLNFEDTIYWKIVPYNDNGLASSCPTWTFVVMPDPTIASFPHCENFTNYIADEATFRYPFGWTIENNGDQWMSWDRLNNNSMNPNNAHSAPTAMHTAFTFLNPIDDWLFTPPLQLDSAQWYKLSFWYKAPPYTGGGDTTFEKAEVKLGNQPNSAAMNLTTLFYNDHIIQPDYIQYEKGFKAPANGNFYIGFHSFSDPMQWIFIIDDVCIEPYTPMNGNDIVNFTIPGQIGNSTISTTNRTVFIDMPSGTNLTSLVPTIELSQNATINPASGAAQNFTDTVTYTVTSESGIEKIWKVKVNIVLSSANDITSFNIPGQASSNISATNHTVNVLMPYGTSVISLTPTIAVSAGATINPNSGVAQNFTYPVNYIVTAENSTQQIWTASVTVAQNTANDILSFAIASQDSSVVNANNHTVKIYMPAGTIVTALVPTITVSPAATINPASGVAQNFTYPVSYMVTAQSGAQQLWTATVYVNNGINNINNNETFTIYPNPSNGNFTLIIPIALAQSQISIIDVNGKKVYENTSVAAGKLDINGIVTGVYTIKLEKESKVFSERLIIE